MSESYSMSSIRKLMRMYAPREIRPSSQKFGVTRELIASVGLLKKSEKNLPKSCPVCSWKALPEKLCPDSPDNHIPGTAAAGSLSADMVAADIPAVDNPSAGIPAEDGLPADTAAADKEPEPEPAAVAEAVAAVPEAGASEPAPGHSDSSSREIRPG